MKRYAIIRHGNKLKHWTKISQVGRHNSRKAETPNADAEQSPFNERPVGTGDLVADVKGVMALHGLNPNELEEGDQVLARELLYTCSPEALFVDPADKALGFDPEKVRAFKERSWEFIDKKWGGRLASADFHVDESSPHWQVVVVPIVRAQTKEEAEAERDERRRQEEAEGKHLKPNGKPKVYRLRQKPARLDAKSIWADRRDRLSLEQSEFADFMAPLGLVRGTKGTKRKHVEIKSLYGQMERERDEAAAALAAAQTELAMAEARNRQAAEKMKETREREARLKKAQEQIVAVQIGWDAIRSQQIVGAEERKGKRLMLFSRLLPKEAVMKLRDRIAPAWGKVWEMAGDYASSIKKEFENRIADQQRRRAPGLMDTVKAQQVWHQEHQRAYRVPSGQTGTFTLEASGQAQPVKSGGKPEGVR